ncbi:uncharacterized protein KNAG_0H01750 [Huiozyma naganishii CBS 8797]|uniref:Uncharacterized protein n=1 Tax=Huiozyma naganishii (strain ATCC MYA-139 / BCRC 22969 / CBS 8797 / KCTC 17520 / NBRC 10181 / NCYC 3082 / Yp74L-3) TaxID=1071383 RepID=J7R9Q2_HUIN7|nr:hypothetical protein KNAG_0H01750 [Kazachstania naganishii CBS 8797]CCK71590.1 hypothetical protein KNAG_0H01750 [Kazachstania naganishii CBS 8797]
MAMNSFRGSALKMFHQFIKNMTTEEKHALTTDDIIKSVAVAYDYQVDLIREIANVVRKPIKSSKDLKKFMDVYDSFLKTLKPEELARYLILGLHPTSYQKDYRNKAELGFRQLIVEMMSSWKNDEKEWTGKRNRSQDDDTPRGKHRKRDAQSSNKWKNYDKFSDSGKTGNKVYNKNPNGNDQNKSSRSSGPQ